MGRLGYSSLAIKIRSVDVSSILPQGTVGSTHLVSCRCDTLPSLLWFCLPERQTFFQITFFSTVVTEYILKTTLPLCMASPSTKVERLPLVVRVFLILSLSKPLLHVSFPNLGHSQIVPLQLLSNTVCCFHALSYFNRFCER